VLVGEDERENGGISEEDKIGHDAVSPRGGASEGEETEVVGVEISVVLEGDKDPDCWDDVVVVKEAVREGKEGKGMEGQGRSREGENSSDLLVFLVGLSLPRKLRFRLLGRRVVS